MTKLLVNMAYPSLTLGNMDHRSSTTALHYYLQNIVILLFSLISTINKHFMTDPDTSYDSTSRETLDYKHIASNIEEAVEHLQDVLNRARTHNLTESWLRIRLADVIIHINNSFNLRHRDSHRALTLQQANKLPLIFIEEWGYTHRSVADFTFNEG